MRRTDYLKKVVPWQPFYRKNIVSDQDLKKGEAKQKDSM